MEGASLATTLAKGLPVVALIPMFWVPTGPVRAAVGGAADGRRRLRSIPAIPTECDREVCGHNSKPLANGRDRSVSLFNVHVSPTRATSPLDSRERLQSANKNLPQGGRVRVQLYHTVTFRDLRLN